MCLNKLTSILVMQVNGIESVFMVNIDIEIEGICRHRCVCVCVCGVRYFSVCL